MQTQGNGDPNVAAPTGEPIYKTPSILFNSALKQVLIANPGIEELEYRGYFFPFIYDSEVT